MLREKQRKPVRQVTHPGDTLREIIRKYKTPVMEKMPPFTGGLVGYFSYDYIKYSEPKAETGGHGTAGFQGHGFNAF